MRRFHIFFVLLFVALLIAGGSTVWATEKDLTYRVYSSGEHQEIEVRTALASYIFSEDGGTLRSVYLYFSPFGTEQRELVQGVKTSSEDEKRQYISEVVFPFQLGKDDEQAEYTLLQPVNYSEDEVVVEFCGTLGSATVVKRFTVYNDPSYTMDVQVTITQPTRSTSIEPVKMMLGSFSPTSKDLDLYYRFDDQSEKSLLAKGSYGTFDGLGLMNDDIVFFLNNETSRDVLPFVERSESGRSVFGVELSTAPGTFTYDFLLYAGRRRFLPMDDAGLGELDSPGRMARLMVPVINFLNTLYRFTGNYGWAIILFTLLTRVILFPLMRKQFHSMAKMQQIQPQLKTIQKRFKDDKQLLQKKMMELYKKEGVNPMGGCLPMFVQLPILILLWRAIMYSAEQIHLSPGFLWVSDLSLRDPYFILVIVTTAIMMLQQKLMKPMTATDGGGSQKYMGYIFPLFMAFFLYNFPAGLWLYYLLTTLFQVRQQYFVNWEMARAQATAPASPAATPSEVTEDDSSADRED